MRQAVNGIIYDTDVATPIARNELPDAIVYLKGYRNRYLYRTADGAFFLYLLTESYFGIGQDADPEIVPLTTKEAATEYEYLDVQLIRLDKSPRESNIASAEEEAVSQRAT